MSIRKLFALIIVFFSAYSGQTQCHYLLEMNDSWGDGWNGARIDITMNGVFVGSYECLDSTTIDSVFSFTGAQMDFIFYSGNWDNEITFSITDPQGNILYSGSAPNNLDNILHTSNSNCPPGSSCINPVLLNAYNTTTTSTDISWTPGGLDSIWNIEWGLSGFSLGTGSIINNLNVNNTTLNGLSPFTSYDFYVQADCDSNGLSTWSGPLTFTTIANAGTCGAFEIKTYDQYGDGWNGGSLEIEVNGNIIQTITLLNGSGPETNSFPVDSADVINLLYSPGDWPEENWYEVFDHDGNLIVIQFSTGNGGPPSTYGLKACPTCLNPNSLSVSNISTNSADLQWNTTISGNLSNVEWGLANFPLGTGNFVNNINANNLSLNSLAPNTNYEFYVQEVCSPTDSSSWEGPYSFITLPDPGTCGAFEIILTDSYGDGWNGGYIDVNINNNYYKSITLISGSGPETNLIPVDSNDVVDIIYSEGDWPEENSYKVFDNNNIIVAAESGSGNNGPNSTYGLIACETIILPSCGNYSVHLFDTFGNGWNNGYLDIEINNNIIFTSTLITGFGPEIVPIPLDSGDIVNLIYHPPIPSSTSSAFDGYKVFDNNNNLIIEEISTDTAGPSSSFGIVACDNFSDLMENPLDNIMVYPNPTNKIININSNIKLERVSLYNALGVLIYDSKKSSKKHQIGVSSFPPNIYYLKLCDSNNQIIKKIIIN